MATDKSPPQTGLILKGAVIAIATLIATHSALVAYFDHIAQAEELRKFGETKPEALINLRTDEKDRLGGGQLPIDKAMQELVARGRTASPDIMPSASKDVAPLQGWVKMPAEVPPAMSAAAAAASSSAQPPLDAGAAPAAVDGAAPKTKPDHAHPDRGPTPSKPPTKNP
jgi:hypothetical protein